MLRLLIILLSYLAAVQSTCPESDQIHCGTSDRCTRIPYICDGDNDCGDYSDEDSELCDAWRNSDCGRGEVECYRWGSNDCISIRSFCDATDPPCEGSLDRRLCQMLRNEKLQPLGDIVLSGDGGPVGPEIAVNLDATLVLGQDFAKMAENTIKNDKCPLLYTQVGEECVSIFFFGHATWGEARAFCQSVGGDLYIPSSHENYIALVHHLSQHHVTADFWIGGNHYNSTLGWRWVTDDPIELGTPQWAIRHQPGCTTRQIFIEHRNVTVEANNGTCYHYTQAPGEVLLGDCLAMTYEKFFFLSDEDCLLKKSPLCKLSIGGPVSEAT